MDRKDAIRYFEDLESLVTGEFSVGAVERESGQDKLAEALEALGVTPAEQEAAWL